MVIIISCRDCKNLLSDKEKKCKAFPLGIPENILLGKDNHKIKYKSQKNDIVFEEIK